MVAAVEQGLFHIYTVDHVGAGMALLTGCASGMTEPMGIYAPDSVLGRAQKTLQAFRRACQLAEHPKVPRKNVR